MTTRRQFVRRFGLALGGGTLIGPGFLGAESRGLLASMRLQKHFSAVDAGSIKVEPGVVIPIQIPGVHIEYLRLRMPDGVRLAATLFLPQHFSEIAPVPGLLKVTPYRKDDGLLGQLMQQEGFFARHGYAGLRVDVRGTGGSEGIAADEYAPKEHEDTLEILDWYSKQPWCNGNIGMFGKSYEAFNALQIAALNPPALKAIVACAGTDDRYTDDVHYMGGSFLMFENFWGLGMIHANNLPAPPDFDVHSASAADRFDNPPWALRWMREQTDGPYWRHGSIRPDYERLKIPMLLVGPYLDGYQNFVPRIMRNSPGFAKGLMTPHIHDWPQIATPGPRIDFREKLWLRWWDEWLKNERTGIREEPRLTYYMPRWHRQGLKFSHDIPGEWRHADGFPDTAYEPGDRLFLRPKPELSPERALQTEPAPGQGGRLADTTGNPSALQLRYYPATGVTVNTFAPTSYNGWYGMDQRADDVYGLVFDTDPIKQPIEILGFAQARLFVSATAPVATWIVRICDVAPDGTSYYITRGVLNGTHRYSHEQPEALIPDEVYELQIGLHCTGWTFEPGHRIRVVVTNADWPHIWPSPYAMTTVLYTGGDRPSHIDLPVLAPADRYSLPGPTFDEPPPLNIEVPIEGRSKPFTWEHTRDAIKAAHQFAFQGSYQTLQHPGGFTNDEATKVVLRVQEENPAVASLAFETAVRVETSDGRIVESRAEGKVNSTRDNFAVNIDTTLTENEKTVRHKRWQEKIRRNLL